MPTADRPAHIGRHVGGRRRWSGKRVRRAATSGLVMGITYFIAEVISKLLFHRDFSSSGDGLHAFVGGLVSFFIAILGVGLAAACAAGTWTRLRRQ